MMQQELTTVEQIPLRPKVHCEWVPLRNFPIIPSFPANPANSTHFDGLINPAQ